MISGAFAISEAPAQERRLEEGPHGQSIEDEERIMRDVDGSPEDGEDERVHAHQEQRVEVRPEDAEDGALVLGPQLAAKQAPEELAVLGEPEQPAASRGPVNCDRAAHGA